MLPFSLFAQKNKIPIHPGLSTVVEIDDPKEVIDGFNLYLPKSYSKTKLDYPVLVFLQGGLGVGGEIQDINNWGLPKMLVEENMLQSEWNQHLLDSFIVISPHMVGGSFKERQFYNQEAAFRDILDIVNRNLRADPNRYYLTGLSRGGHGTWGLASRMEDVFAAVAPICGGLHGVETYEPFDQIAVWVFHNTGDDRVGYQNSVKGVKAIEMATTMKFKALNSVNPSPNHYMKERYLFSSIEKEGHDAWTDAYGQVHLYKWLLLQTK